MMFFVVKRQEDTSPGTQLQVKLQKTADITYLEVKIQQTR